MIIRPTPLNGVFEIENQLFEDHRGRFVKTFHAEIFRSSGLEHDFRESFYSISKNGVLRGMHFQLPPHDHAKLVYVIAGEILDVAVDVRKDSPSHGRHYSARLSGENCKSLYMTRGLAHGFLTLSDSATVVYMTTSVHSPEHDTGIRWDSFGFEWPIGNPVISERDSGFLPLNDMR